ncbi:Solute carrier family 22 member 8 [Araneus ventricosus]|uniref:Solute carrier family 22 member 8 n=1 Tax=Araneus ventricosus TaxID=182803 RepID=A0A4Y2AXB6_ARAVE|nr:Solute carrier family 22 member 8 [Araneus ventricosus]
MTMISTAPSHLDRILLMVGSPGRYHLLVAFLLCCMQFPVSFSDHLLAFYTVTPKHRCRADANLTLGDYDLRPIVTENGKRFYSACSLFADPLDHSKGTKPCDNGWEFMLNKGESSVVTEWELVCERESLVALLPYLKAVSAMTGALVTGMLADKYGRKYVLILSLLFHTSFGVFLHFLPLYGIFATVFTFQGFLIAGVQCTSYLLLIENLPTKWHEKAALAIALFQCSGQLILAVLAWLIRHWRYVQLVISAPGVVVIGYFWLLPRSLAWLVVENRQHSVQRQLARFSNESKLAVSPSLRLQLLKACRVALSMPHGYAARHRFETIICSARLRALAFTQYYIWFVVSLVSKCTIEDLPVFKDNIFSRLFVHGILEMALVILIFLASGSIGLKLTQGSSLSICGVCCMFAAIINHEVMQMRSETVSERGLHHFAPLFGLLGKCIASASCYTLWIHAIKTFPTGIRGLGVGSCLLWSRVAYFFIPNIEELDTHSQFIVLALGGVLCFVGGILSYWLYPDVTARPLATIAEEVEIGRTKIINDSDLDFHDTTMPPGFMHDNDANHDPETGSHTTGSLNATMSKNLLKRLTDMFQRKTHKILQTTSHSITKMGCNKPPIRTVVGGDVFEPVTGFVFKWDHHEPTVKISEFEKELSTFWKPCNETCEKKIYDKHLNSLNVLYNIECNQADDFTSDSVELEGNSEEPRDSTL